MEHELNFDVIVANGLFWWYNFTKNYYTEGIKWL